MDKNILISDIRLDIQSPTKHKSRPHLINKDINMAEFNVYILACVFSSACLALNEVAQRWTRDVQGLL